MKRQFRMPACHAALLVPSQQIYWPLWVGEQVREGPLVWHAPFKLLGCQGQGCSPVLLSWQVWGHSLKLLGCQAQDYCSCRMPNPFRQGQATRCGRLWPGPGHLPDVVKALILQPSHNKLYLLKAFGLQALCLLFQVLCLPPQVTSLM